MTGPPKNILTKRKHPRNLRRYLDIHGYSNKGRFHPYCLWFRNPKQPPRMYKTLQIMGYFLPASTAERRISEPSTIEPSTGEHPQSRTNSCYQIETSAGHEPAAPLQPCPGEVPPPLLFNRATPKASAVLFIGDKVPQRWGRSRSEKRRSWEAPNKNERFTGLPSWWWNQPRWKIFVKMGSSSPIFGMKHKKYVSCHHLVYPSWN